MHSDSQASHYCRCLTKALNAAHRLLDGRESDMTHDSIHSVKSLLYAAIGQVEIKVDRQMDIRRQLRELMSLITLSADLQEEERRAGLQILQELISRYGSQEFAWQFRDIQFRG